MKAHQRRDRDGTDRLLSPRPDVAPRDLRAAVPGLRACTRGESRACASHTRDAAAYGDRFARVMARDSHSRDAWAFKSSRWTHRQLPFRRDSPRAGKRTVRESVWEIPSSCTPCVPLSHVPRTFAFRDHDFGFRETRFRFAELPRSRRRADSVPSVSRSHTTARARARTRRARRTSGERVRAAGARGAREAPSRGARGRDAIRRARSVESRARRGCALGGLGACLSASLARYRSAPRNPHLARWRRASPTPRPWSGSRA